MAYTREQVEQLHDSGKMPDWVYYQTVKKPAWLAWQEQRDKFISEIEERKQQQSELEQLEEMLAEMFGKAIVKALFNDKKKQARNK